VQNGSKVRIATAQWRFDGRFDGRFDAQFDADRAQPIDIEASALAGLDGPSTLVLVFGAASLLDHPDILAPLAAAFPAAVVIGCSTAGEILGETLSDDTVTVTVCRFEHTRLALVGAEVTGSGESFEVGARLAAQLVDADAELAAMLVLSDGLGVNGSELTRGLTAGSRGSRQPVVIAGGLAGDGDRFERTWVLVDGKPRTGMVTAVGLSGTQLHVGYGSQGGWDVLGPERLITRSEGNVLYELDGKPALALYRSYLGERASGLPATALLFPLSLRLPGTPERVVMRTILGIDEEQQSMTFAGDVPQNSLTRLMRANIERVVDGACSAAEAAQVIEGVPVLAIAISCVGRRLVLGQRTEDELDAVLSGLPAGTQLTGFYAYGEISPISRGTCDLLNQTMTIATIQEAVQ
jgi:hypothetical protein